MREFSHLVSNGAFKRMQIAKLTSETISNGLFRLSFTAMGSPCEITYSCESAREATAFRERSLEWVRNFENRYSRYLPESLISRINRTAGTGESIEIEEEDERLFKLCDTLHFFTRGLFDPTTLPLAQLWNFKAEKPRIPNDGEIKVALTKINWKKVTRKDGQVSLPELGMGLDFGGFGKEYAVDRVMEMGRRFGISDLLVNFGGDLRTLGSPPDSPHWRVGIEDPNQPGQARFTVRANDLAVATSGNYQRFFEINGKRYGHLLDHRTGFPTSSDHLSATVIAKSCLEAGILATCSLMDEHLQGLGLIENHFGSEGCVWTKSGMVWSKKFDTHLLSQ